MSAQHVQSLPKRIEKEKLTKRDDLYNDVLEFLEKEGVAWYTSEVDGAGKRFVSALVDTLWYIDGHHDVFEKQSCKIPSVFTSFAGYNTPHAPKHRKRSAANMSGSSISSHASTLFGCLQAGNTLNFRSLKQLLRSLLDVCHSTVTTCNCKTSA